MAEPLTSHSQFKAYMAPRVVIPKKLKEPLQRLDALLRLVEPDQPFQPVLAASLDTNAWRACFVVGCDAIRDACSDATSTLILTECDALCTFASTVFADSYFDRFYAADMPDRDPQEFAPDDEFFKDSSIWNHATAAAAAQHKCTTQGHINDLDGRWCQVSGALHEAFTDYPCDKILNAALDKIGNTALTSEVRHWLEPPTKEPNDARPTRNLRVYLHEFVRFTLLPGLTTSITDASLAKTSVRQSAKKRITKNASDFLAHCCLREGWSRLLVFAATAVALRMLLNRVYAALSESFKIPVVGTSGKEMLDLLHAVPRDALDPHLIGLWEEHLKDAAQLQAVAGSLGILKRGAAQIGKNTLGRVLQGADNPKSAKSWVDKADERLRKLGAAEIAVHGSENWVHPPRPSKPLETFQSPRPGHGWLVNPLLVLWDPVYKAL